MSSLQKIKKRIITVNPPVWKPRVWGPANRSHSPCKSPSTKRAVDNHTRSSKHIENIRTVARLLDELYSTYFRETIENVGQSSRDYSSIDISFSTACDGECFTTTSL